MAQSETNFSFHLFEDGEGVSASTDSSSQEQNKPEIQYGKAPKGERTSTGQAGSDRGGQQIPPSSSEEEFAKLVGKGGQYHDIYGRKVSEAVQQRFKNQADLQGQVDGYEEALSPLFMAYNLQPGDIDGLANAIQTDENFYRNGAEREGLSIDQYRENLKLKAEAERGRQITEAYERQQRQNEMFASWESQSEILKETFPSFDLGMEIQTNEAFAKLLDAGTDVQTAFISTHLPEILNGSQAETAQRATREVISAMQQRAARPMESAARPAPAIQRKSDPSTLTNKDIDEINKRVEMGEKFSF